MTLGQSLPLVTFIVSKPFRSKFGPKQDDATCVTEDNLCLNLPSSLTIMGILLEGPFQRH